jgi:hypothetical protein
MTITEGSRAACVVSGAVDVAATLEDADDCVVGGGAGVLEERLQDASSDKVPVTSIRAIGARRFIDDKCSIRI